MKCASVVKQVNPTDPFYMVGYVGSAREKPAEGVRDIPEVNTLVLQVGIDKLVFISVDVCVFGREKSNEVRQELANEFSIPFENISIIAIHSHSCPNGTIDGGFNAHNENISFYSQVKQAMHSSIEECIANLTEVTASYQKVHIEGFYSNRNDKNVPYDNEVIEIKFADKDSKSIALFSNICCHSTVLGPTNMLCSYDLIGTIRKQLRDYYGCNTLVTMGTAGDISNRQYRQGDGFEELDRCATGITNQIINANSFSAIDLNDCSIDTITHVIDYDNTQYFEKYRKLLKETEEILSNPDISKDQFKLSSTSKVQFEKKLNVEHVHKEIITKVYHLSNCIIIGFGGEMSSKFGLEMKRNHPNSLLFTITCCDDDAGYFIEEDKYGLYYETIATDIPKGEPEKIVEEIQAKL